MAGAQAFWGIDVGRCALKALKLRIGPEKTVEVLAHDYIEHAKILSQPDADRHELIASALEKFLSRNDISKDGVVVSVPGQHTLARFTKLPPVAPKRIPDIVRYEADQQIPFDMDEVIWDYQTFAQEGMPDVEVGIFAMKRELLREHLLYFEQAAIEPVAVQSLPLALYNAACYDGMLGPETTVLLDVGAENTDLVVATPGSLWTRTIPVGGNSLTEALVKSFKLSFSKAENLKRTADTSKYRRQIFQAMRPVFSDLVQELQRSIGFYSSTHRDAQIGKVVGVGNAFRLPGLQKYLQQNLGMSITIPTSFEKVAPSEAADAETLKEQRLSFFGAYGLALQGLDLGSVTSNLLPTEIAKQTVWRKKKPAFAAAAACLLLAGALIWFRQTADMRALAAASGGRPQSTESLEEAADIIDNGPLRSLSSRAQAASIRDACKWLKRELNRMTSEGQAEREETEKLIELQGNKTVILRIMQLVHESVPVEDGALGQAETQADVLAALEAGAPPRDQRRRVVIDSLQMQFEPNLNDYEWPETLVQVPDRINDDLDAILPGIEVKIRCRTPNDHGPKFINEAFMTSLRTSGRRPGQGFYFDRVHLVEGGRIGSQGESGGSGAGRFAFGSGPRLGGVAGAGDVLPEDHDVITNEPATEDWRFDVWLDVILEDYPEPESEEEEAEGETEEEEEDDAEEGE